MVLRNTAVYVIWIELDWNSVQYLALILVYFQTPS